MDNSACDDSKDGTMREEAEDSKSSESQSNIGRQMERSQKQIT